MFINDKITEIWSRSGVGAWNSFVLHCSDFIQNFKIRFMINSIFDGL